MFKSSMSFLFPDQLFYQLLRELLKGLSDGLCISPYILSPFALHIFGVIKYAYMYFSLLHFLDILMIVVTLQCPCLSLRIPFSYSPFYVL